MKTALVCIAKEETRYIRDFVTYHLSLGFSSVYIYDNGHRTPLIDTLCNLKNVYIVTFPGKNRQFDAYNHFFKQFGSCYTHAMVMDCDEFLVFKNHSTIDELIQFCNLERGAVCINWRIFGSNDEKEYKPEHVVKRFTRREDEDNEHIKCLVVCSDVIEYNNPHYPTKLKRGTKTTNLLKEDIQGPFNNKPCYDVAQINHYFTKSYNEFVERRNQGTADGTVTRTLEFFHTHDRNVEEDLYARNHLEKLSASKTVSLKKNLTF